MEGFKNTNATLYTYDTNGNLTVDPDKGITITYNHLNLPTKIAYSATKYIDIVYDAGGGMLSRRMVDTGVNNKIDYVGGIEFYNGVTQSIMHGEGRVYYPTPTTPRYEYTISDHLGNARIMYSDLNNDGKIATPTEILWEGQYYPFGLAHKGAWMDTPDKELNYKYNGIELAEDFGLNVNLATFRTLDPAIGRWWQVDPKAEANYGLSPYNSMNNNPISIVDPNGDLGFLAAVGIGAAIGAFTGASIQQGTINPGQWQSDWYKGAVVGAIIGAGIGLGTSALLSQSGAVSGIFPASNGIIQSSTTAWNIVSNSLITANTNIVSSALQGRNFNDIFNSGLVGLGAGAIGGAIGGSFHQGNLGPYEGALSQKAIKITNSVTAGLNGFGDRLTNSLSHGEGFGSAFKNGLFGIADGLYSSRLANKMSKLRGPLDGVMTIGQSGRYLSSAATQALTSVPGLGMAIGSTQDILSGYRIVAASPFALIGGSASSSLTTFLKGGYLLGRGLGGYELHEKYYNRSIFYEP